jgi:RHS repeat-associated protein
VYDYRARQLAQFTDGQTVTTNTIYPSSYTVTNTWPHTWRLYSGGLEEREYDLGNATAWALNLTSANLTKEYVRGSDMGGGVGGVLYDLTPSGNTTTPNYYHYDGRGDVVGQTDSSGYLGYQASYTADGAHNPSQGFANGLFLLGNAPGSFGAQEADGYPAYDNGNNLQANTKREELAKGIDYVNDGQRYRDLFSGRFLTRDPAGYVDGTNEFNYVRGNPWTSWDPEGLADNGTTTDNSGSPTTGQYETRLNLSGIDLSDPNNLEKALDPKVAKQTPDMITATSQAAGLAGQTVVMGQPTPSGGASVESAALGSAITAESKAPGLFTRAADAVVDFFGLGQPTVIVESAEAMNNEAKVATANVAPTNTAEGTLIQRNAAQGQAYQQVAAGQAAQTQTGVVQELTLQTQSGVKTRIDIAGRDATTGAVQLTEAKSSQTAPLTKNQAAAFPEIQQTGATVVGKGKPGFPGGLQIPPTTVNVVRPTPVSVPPASTSP